MADIVFMHFTDNKGKKGIQERALIKATCSTSEKYDAFLALAANQDELPVVWFTAHPKGCLPVTTVYPYHATDPSSYGIKTSLRDVLSALTPSSGAPVNSAIFALSWNQSKKYEHENILIMNADDPRLDLVYDYMADWNAWYDPWEEDEMCYQIAFGDEEGEAEGSDFEQKIQNTIMLNGPLKIYSAYKLFPQKNGGMRRVKMESNFNTRTLQLEWKATGPPRRKAQREHIMSYAVMPIEPKDGVRVQHAIDDNEWEMAKRIKLPGDGTSTTEPCGSFHNLKTSSADPDGNLTKMMGA